MCSEDLYQNLDDFSKEQLRNLADELLEVYTRGDLEGQPKGRVILFLGAAANYQAPSAFEEYYSRQDRPPMATELCNLFIDDLYNAEDEDKRDRVKKEKFPLSWITQYYEEVRDRRKLIEKLAAFIDEKKISPILKALARMPFKYIITTNYDNLFEQALASVNKTFLKGVYKPNKYGKSEYTPDPKEKITINNPFVYKVHGDIKETFNNNGDYIPAQDSIVITDDDYLHFILRMSQNTENSERDDANSNCSYYPIPGSINEAFTGASQNTFLFIGYGLKDYNLRLILKTALWRKDSNILRAVKKWSIDLDPDPAIKQIWINNFRLAFIEKDIWCAVPYLYKLLFKEEMPL